MRTRPRLKVLGLSALVMGVMAIGTTGAAQGEVGACWGYINAAKELKCFSAQLEATPIFAIEENTGTLLIENLNLEILCTGMEFDEGGQLSANGSILLGRIKFTGCIARERAAPLGELKILAACLPQDPFSGPDVILTEKATGLIILHNGQPLVKISPDNEQLILTNIFMGPECPVAAGIVVKGHLDLEDLGGQESFEKHELTHLFKESSLQLMRVGVRKATLDGSVNATLAAPHNALKWAGLAA